MSTSRRRMHRATTAAALLLGVAASGPLLAAPARTECSSPPAGTVFCEDFEGTNPKSHFDDYDGNPESENQVVTDTGPSGDSSNRAIRLRVPEGQRGSSDLLKVLPSGHDKLYARWYAKYETGFNFEAGNHGGGLAAGDRSYLGRSGIRPDGNDYAAFFLQHQEGTAKPYSYSYYRGMYQQCTDPNGSCWGDSLPCVYDSGASYCTKPQHRPSVGLPKLDANRWYCIEEMVDMGTPSTKGSVADGRFALWLDSQSLGNFGDIWIRTSSSLQLRNLLLSLFFGDSTHSAVGELIDNVVVSTQPIGCGDVATAPAPPSNLRVVN